MEAVPWQVFSQFIMDDKGRTNHPPPPTKVGGGGMVYLHKQTFFLSKKNITSFPSRSKTLFRGNYFFAQIWEANYSLKTPPPPPVLNCSPLI